MWLHTFACLGLAFYCIHLQFDASLPWIAATAGLPWAAYGVSQVYYYKKSQAENTCGGLKYEATLKELDSYLNDTLNKYESQVEEKIDWSVQSPQASYENEYSSPIQEEEFDIYYGI